MSLRTPLRPLARILEARRKGENPDAIERENRRLRHEAERDKMRVRAESRLLLVACCFLAAFCTVGYRMAALATSEPVEPRVAGRSGDAILNTRADIVDRQGRVLATNFATNALYAHPHEIIDAEAAAEGLAEIFPDMDAEALHRRFTSEARFIWLRRYISPEQEQQVHDLGEPGLLFGPREMRLYPNGAIAAHVLGGAGFGQEAVNAAEVVGIAGVEALYDAQLRDPARDGPLRLSLDLTVQAAVEEVLAGGMALMNAQGAAAVLMDADTGEIVALASLPDFDPNARPRPLTEGDQADSPLFNRSLQGVYELGSVFKTFTIAQALEDGVVGLSDMIDTTGPLRMAGFEIRDFSDHGREQSVADVFVHSSNIGTARIARMMGGERQRAFLDRLGLLQPTDLELVEAAAARPLQPRRWGELATMTISYGHGLSTSPVHLASAYATMVNGGTRVSPTILRRAAPQMGERVISEQTSAAMRSLLRSVVTDGTASFGEVPGYSVGGKTGSAELPRPQGGYYDDRNINTFASVFPTDDPEYVLVVTLYEPVETSGPEPRRTAGWTAVPVAAEVIRRVAPLLGLRPEIEPAPLSPLSSSSN
ncbi:Cell division protein FtsI (Peptidoglycan synthetase) [Roseibacterium elongatum DSM 19469]|uniref:Cell division protein FtsI (Peptidoglycan synthetase) n=1 Tax=Roseicyclus elongatus DSM 19469 TaxID=1294273 RepID=W8S9M1_9RHOB|nr:penicillin-binding protein 2 [Roseibacterium elongatum]AHM05706.1 Cell division protein FtsI (Peptidoglycan synthetase) [Roseibacterium elongatum DSM 19469]